MNFQTTVFKSLLENRDLNTIESKELARIFFDKSVDNVKLSSLLTLLHIKGESFNEIYAFVKLLKKNQKKINLKGDLMDTCGTGGDSKNSFNFSTAVSILLASCGVKIAKHGNRSITSKSGSFDILESLGININLNDKHLNIFENL